MLNPCRLLVVDDEEDLRVMLFEALADLGWQASGAENGERALKILAVEQYDVVLLDFRMPGLTGAEVYQRLRASGNDIPVILMTAARHIEDIAQSLGVARFVGKPFDLDELIEAVQSVADC